MSAAVASAPPRRLQPKPPKPRRIRSRKPRVERPPADIHLPHKGMTPLRVIARKLGISERTVSTDYNSALAKLKAQPGAFSLLLAWVHACADVDAMAGKQAVDRVAPYIGCGSVECRRDWIALYARE